MNRSQLPATFALTLLAGFAPACGGAGPDGGSVFGSGGTTTDEGGSSSAGSAGSTGEDPSGGSTGDDPDGPKFDVPVPDMGDGDACPLPEHVPCDGDGDLFHAMGLGCAGEHPVTTSTIGPAVSLATRNAFGSTATFDPREGQEYAVISTGKTAELDLPGDDWATNCSDAVNVNYTGNEPLPPPLQAKDVGLQDCNQDPTLVGTGDCSNTIEGQYSQGAAHYDYAEMRVQTEVPQDATQIGFDFAYFTVEYPNFYQKQFNDMFVVWLESEAWTGNISFDEQGNPISLNAGFLDYRDAQLGTTKDPACANGCVAEELHGTCMEYHAGTKWLHTTAPVTPGEDITVVFAIFDMADPNLDSTAFIDNFEFGCGDGPPVTEPAG